MGSQGKKISPYFFTIALDLDLRFRFVSDFGAIKKYVPQNMFLKLCSSKYNIKYAPKDTEAGSLLKQVALTNTNFDVPLPCAVQELNENEK